MMKLKLLKNTIARGHIHAEGTEIETSDTTLIENLKANGLAEEVKPDAQDFERETALKQLNGKNKAELLDIIATAGGEEPAPNATKADLINVIMAGWDRDRAKGE